MNNGYRYTISTQPPLSSPVYVDDLEWALDIYHGLIEQKKYSIVIVTDRLKIGRTISAYHKGLGSKK